MEIADDHGYQLALRYYNDQMFNVLWKQDQLYLTAYSNNAGYANERS
jgi:hypothetical protein